MYDYQKIAKDAVELSQNFYKAYQMGPTFMDPMRTGIIYFKYVCKVLDENLKAVCPTQATYEEERARLFYALETTFMLDQGRLEQDLDSFSLSRIKEAIYDFSGPAFRNDVDEWCATAKEQFKNVFMEN